MASDWGGGKEQTQTAYGCLGQVPQEQEGSGLRDAWDVFSAGLSPASVTGEAAYSASIITS